MEELEKEHYWAESLHAEVDRLGRKYLDEGIFSNHDSAEFRNALDALAAMYQQHIKVEDELLFPFAEKALTQADKLAIAAEMVGRRR
jgi:hemerythrin-like domain-containing protein